MSKLWDAFLISPPWVFYPLAWAICLSPCVAWVLLSAWLLQAVCR